MAESACLRRSFSNPSEISHDFQQGDPVRALGESISFGRYMSESLAWERWSTFSHNRYLEEAEKSSKPGSVAKMKAYFEAHYSRIGANKRAAQEEANNELNGVEQKEQNTSGSSPSNTKNKLPDEHETVYDIQRKEFPSVEVPSNVTVSSCASVDQFSELQGMELSSVEPEGPEIQIMTGILPSNTENTQPDDHATALEIPRKETPDVELPFNVTVSPFASVPIDELKGKELHISESGVNLDTTDESCEVQVHECKNVEVYASVDENNAEIKMKQCTDVKETDATICTPAKKHLVKEVENKNSRSRKNSTDSSFKKSVKSNVSKLSSSLARLSTPIRPKMEGSDTPNIKKPKMESLDKKKSVSRLIETSTNSDVKKTSPASHKAVIGKVFTPLGKILRDRFTPSPAPVRQECKNSFAQHPPMTPQSQTKRSKVALEKSFSKSKILDQKLYSPSPRNMKSAVQSPTVFSSFRLRTEERAAKRREFFQKRLEKEAENLQLEKAKVKPKIDTKKSSHCVNQKAIASKDIRINVLSDDTKKNSCTVTQLPKSGAKLVLNSRQVTKPILDSPRMKKPALNSPRVAISALDSPRVAKPALDSPQVACPRPPQKSSNSKLTTEKCKPVPTRPSTLPTRKKIHENTSPNIL